MKQFIKITSENKAKNKAQELVQEHLLKLDQTLRPDIYSARLSVITAFKHALSKYTGKAKLPELKRYDPSRGTVVYCVEGLIYLSIYTVKNEL